MALIYFDSSAFVKLVVEEEGSDVAAALWDGCDAALSSRLAYAEVCGALASALRNHDLNAAGHREALREWKRFWAAIRPVELTELVTQQAGELARSHALRGADAIHLASALAVDRADLVVAVWDHRLHDGVVAARLAVAPGTL